VPADAVFELKAPAVPQSASGPRYVRAAHDYQHIGIGRRTFFRWKECGIAHADWPPFDHPTQLEAWYLRMREFGAFKHQFPAAVREAIAVHLSGNPPTAAPSPASTAAASIPPPPAPFGSSPPPLAADEFQGLEHELHEKRSRVVALRQARDAFYATGDRTQGDLQDSRYNEAYSELTIAEKRTLEVLEKRKLLISRSGIEQDLAPRITGIVVGGMHFLDRIEPQLDAIVDPTERRAKRRALWIEHCQPLMQGKFVPDFIRRAPVDLWQECAAWLQAKTPPPLTLDAA
jgi:hypothetical protein